MPEYLQNYHDILHRPDIRPLIHPAWTPETSHIEIGRQTCLLSSEITIGGIYDPSEKGHLRIRRSDLEDLRRIWLQNHYGNTTKPSLLRGYWKIDNWEHDSDNAISIVQYKTFRVCLRGGSGTVV